MVDPQLSDRQYFQMTTTFKLQSTQPDALLYTGFWFHDALHETDPEFCECDNCRFKAIQQTWADQEQRAQQHEYGLCMECGVGLDHANEFLVDRRQKCYDCFTCDKCFKDSFGDEAFVEATSWQILGIVMPQYVRFSFPPRDVVDMI